MDGIRTTSARGHVPDLPLGLVSRIVRFACRRYNEFAMTTGIGTAQSLEPFRLRGKRATDRG